MITKIISGGQTGADTGGLMAARKLRIETGGWMPKGFRRLTGNDPSFKDMYGMKEHPSHAYPPRTLANVASSDGTVRFASNFQSPGERCTLKAIKAYEKPYFDVNVNDPKDKSEFLKWIKDNNIGVLNVAGNSEENCRGICDFVVEYLYKALS